MVRASIRSNIILHQGVNVVSLNLFVTLALREVRRAFASATIRQVFRETQAPVGAMMVVAVVAVRMWHANAARLAANAPREHANAPREHANAPREHVRRFAAVVKCANAAMFAVACAAP